MTAPTKSLRCTQDLRAFPWQSYVLPTDGRKAMAVAEQRRTLTHQLSLYANPDGTHITVGHERLMRELGWTRRKLFYRLADLHVLGILPDKDGLVGENGTAVRRIDLSVLTRAGVQDTEQECKIGGDQECRIGEQECEIDASTPAGVQDTRVGVHPCVAPNRSTEEPNQPSNRPQTEPAGWEGWLLQTSATIGIPSAKEKQELRALAGKEPNGFEFLKQAILIFENRSEGLIGLKKPWRMFLSQAGDHMKVAKAKCMASTDWRIAHDKEFADFHAASIERQTQELIKRMHARPKQNEMSLEDLMAV